MINIFFADRKHKGYIFERIAKTKETANTVRIRIVYRKQSIKYII